MERVGLRTAVRRCGAALITLAAVSAVGVPWAGASKPSGGGGGGAGAIAASGFSGRAYVAGANLTVLGAPITVGPISDTGPLPSTGGLVQTSLLTVGDPSPTQVLVNGEVASSSTAGAGDQSNSSASVAGVSVGVGTLTPDTVVVHAAVLRSQAHAACTTNGPVTSGASQITALSVNGLSVAVNGQPNQTIDVLGLATVVVNEQIAGPGAITVNALHVSLHQVSALGASLLGGDVVISSAHSDVTCPAGTPPPALCPVKDFVTAGGYVDPSSGRVNFGMVGGQKANGLSGHFNLVDHGTGQHISAGTLVGYSDPTSTSRKLVYSGDVDGQPATITVVVVDNGEPGSADTFSVTAGAYTRSGTLGGGNVQLHKPGGCQTSTKGH